MVTPFDQRCTKIFASIILSEVSLFPYPQIYLFHFILILFYVTSLFTFFLQQICHRYRLQRREQRDLVMAVMKG
jgi:hypothetical protein